MARSRNIKPGFFANDLLAEVHPFGRLLFAGIWTLADREGRLEDRPKKIKAQVFPYDDCDVDALLGELANRRFIQRYEASGLRLIQVTTWHKHQNPHIKETASTLPAPCEHGAHPMPTQDEHVLDTPRQTDQTGAAVVEHPACTGTTPRKPKASTVPAAVENAPNPMSASAPAGKTTESGRADSDSLISDSPSPMSEFPIPPSQGTATEARGTKMALRQDDSDEQKSSTGNDPGIPSLGAIAKKVALQLSPSEVAGYIMAHFPMQQLDRRQRPTMGDSGLTLEQVNCIVRHGCTIENAKKAFEHFQQERAPNKIGAWAVHCLKEELSADARLDLREETRSAQREFKKRTGGVPSGERQQDHTAPPVSPGASSL